MQHYPLLGLYCRQGCGYTGLFGVKGCIDRYDESTGKEYAETGISANTMVSAIIRTPLVDAMPDEQVKYMTDMIPMKRCCLLQEATDLVLYIVSLAKSFTTGFVFDLSSGRATN